MFGYLKVYINSFGQRALSNESYLIMYVCIRNKAENILAHYNGERFVVRSSTANLFATD